ncbi:MAG: tetratricopeptide repeat protein, partial [Phaeodactylibacter sp.]|nr:tetratricopeptide repeat protein [Phaeodactylibacter sp.]
ESLNLYTELKDTVWMGNVMNGMGILYAEQKKTGKALETLETALSLYKQQGMEEYTAFPLSNIGNYYLEYLDQPELALNYFQQALKLDQKYDSANGEAISLENLGLAYHSLGQYNAAIEHFMKSLEIAQEQHFNELISKIYKNLCKSYEAKGDLKNALQYLGKHQMLQDSILNVSKNAQIADLLAFFDSEQKEQDLLESREKIAQLEQEKKISNLWTAILAGSVLALGSIFYLFAKQHRTRRKLIEIDLKNNELEREKLSRELEFKNKDLTNFALDIARKNEFSNMVHESLKEIVNSPPNESRKKARELLMSTSNHLQINDDIKEFQMNVETVNQDFFNRLIDQFPDLTPNERHLCGLIRLNLSTKEIAVIRNISPKSVEMGRYRLRKKLNLDPKEEITNFLQDF